MPDSRDTSCRDTSVDSEKNDRASPDNFRTYLQVSDPARDNLPVGVIAGSRMTLGDLIFQFFRPVLYLTLLVFCGYSMDVRFPGLASGWIWLASISILVAFYVVVRVIFRFILGLRHIGTLDELQMYDMATNKSIITAVLFFDKLDSNAILERLKERMLKHFRLRCLFVKLFDQYYLKEQDAERL